MADKLEHSDRPPMVEKGPAPADKPDTGVKPDLKNPEVPEEHIPGKPIPDMNPPGQEEPEQKQ